jgi:hypothetical protein
MSTLLAADAAAQWQGGAKVGFGQSGFTGSSEFTWNRGPRSSVFVSLLVAPVFAAQFEATALRVVGFSNTAGSNLTLTADYLTFPIFGQLRLPTSVGATPYLSGGPIFAIRLSCGLAVVVGGIETSQECDAAGRASSSPVTAGVGAGAGIEQAFGIATFLVEGRVATGLSVESVPVDARRPRRFGWGVLAGASLPLGRSSEPPQAPVPQPRPSAVVTRPSEPLPASALPSIVVEDIVDPDVARVPLARARPRDALDAVGSNRLVSVNAADADVRSLLLWIARQGGVSIVVDPVVSGRVWVTLTDVPVAEALRAVTEAANLVVSSTSVTAIQPAVVFYQLPVNIDSASAGTIARRFNVSDELAKWVVENQPRSTSP